MSYRDAPRTKPGPLEKCCSCKSWQKRPVKGEVDQKLEMGKPVPIIKSWCATCGLYLTTKDHDYYFPSPIHWTESTPLEPVEDA